MMFYSTVAPHDCILHYIDPPFFKTSGVFPLEMLCHRGTHTDLFSLVGTNATYRVVKLNLMV